jgi:hypothetical protein
VFTYRSFLALWAELESAELVGWRLLAAEDVREDENEFRVLLAAGPAEVRELPL